MDKWTVSLFGHYKPYAEGCERRAQPGDMIAFKPFEREDTWTPTERKEFLIVTMEGPTKSQMDALCEVYWDLDSYNKYSPYSMDDFVKALVIKIQNKPTAKDPAVLDRMLKDLEGEKEELYGRYIAGCKERCMLPTQHFKKRRFSVPLSTLEVKGIDMSRMLNKDAIYSPVVFIDKLENFDKLRSRTVLETDGLNLISPLTDAEIEARKI